MRLGGHRRTSEACPRGVGCFTQTARTGTAPILLVSLPSKDCVVDVDSQGRAPPPPPYIWVVLTSAQSGGGGNRRTANARCTHVPYPALTSDFRNVGTSNAAKLPSPQPRTLHTLCTLQKKRPHVERTQDFRRRSSRGEARRCRRPRPVHHLTGPCIGPDPLHQESRWLHGSDGGRGRSGRGGRCSVRAARRPRVGAHCRHDHPSLPVLQACQGGAQGGRICLRGGSGGHQ